MRLQSFILIIVSLFGTTLRSAADERSELLAQGTRLLPDAPVWRLSMSNGVSTIITYERPAISPGPIVQAKTVALQKDLWRTQASTYATNQAYSAGDMLLLTARARCLETTNTTGSGILHAHFELAEPPYPKMYSGRFNVAKEWTRLWMPFQLQRDIPKDKGKLIFNLGYAVQMIELCDVQLYSFPAGFDMGRLPKSEPATAKP